MFDIYVNAIVYHTEKVTYLDLINEAFALSNLSMNITGYQCDWYLKGSSKKDLLKTLAFTSKGITENAIQVIHDKFLENAEDPFLGYSGSVEVWNGTMDITKSMSVNIRYLGERSDKRIVIRMVFSIKEENPQNREHMLKIVEHIYQNWHPAMINVNTNQYSLQMRNVFQERLSVGWMLYLPVEITAQQVPTAYQVKPIVVNNKNIGSLIISVAHTFDGNNPDDIHAANDIEINLVESDLLPLYKNIKSPV